MTHFNLTKILSSDECTSFSIAFLGHSIFLCCLSFIFYAANCERYISPLIIQSVISELETVELDPIEIQEINIIHDHTSLLMESFDQNIPDSSFQTNELEIPSIAIVDYDISDVSNIFDDHINDQIGGLSQYNGNGISPQSSSEGALDRLTLEIIRNAETKNLTVVWLFDSSISLSGQRQQIHDRFDRILSEIDITSHKKSINHSICSFGSSIKFITTDPSNNCQILKRDISSIALDLTGIENTFSAILEVCKKYSSSERLMVIVFTDEIGDDINLLEKATHLAQSKGSMIYVVGSPSPFGKSKAQFKFTEFDPKYANTEEWVEVQQGPETLYRLILDLHSLPIDDETLDSGFGPFGLSKICLDTGGIFFSIHPNRNQSVNRKQDISPLASYISRFFDHNVMQMYRPDYRHISLQAKDNNHITKKSLIQASLITLNITHGQTTRFQAYNESIFVDQLNMAQRFAAKLEPEINTVYNILLAGEPAYQTLQDKRWVASYCLAMGRILATKCRIENYNHMLAEAKFGLKKKDSKSNVWILIPSPGLNINNGTVQKQYDKAQQYLRFVVNNFPDTPWALIAQAELDTPFGYSWIEDYQEPPKTSGGDSKPTKPTDDKKSPKLQPPKPKRDITKI